MESKTLILANSEAVRRSHSKGSSSLLRGQVSHLAEWGKDTCLRQSLFETPRIQKIELWHNQPFLFQSIRKARKWNLTEV